MSDYSNHMTALTTEHFPFRAIQITRKPPAWRTDSEIRHLRNRLQLLESFRQYSPNLQLLLAKVIRFERFGRRRVIIKKGHWATSFYFIYFGSVAITDDEDGSSAFADTVPTTLQRGAAFGEIALLQRTRRIATVVCMEETELLVVDKKDFFGYKLDKELQKECKYRYDFLRNLDLFETMSDAAIEKIANFCRIERFHYGQVITNDLKDTTMIIFITKGICEILRLIDLSTCPSYHKWISKQLCLPRPKLEVREKRHIASGMYVRFILSHIFLTALCEPELSSTPSSSPEDDKEVVQKVVSGEFIRKPAYTTSYGELPDSVAAAVYIRIDELGKPVLTSVLVSLYSDDELCQVFLRQNAWEFFKKDLLDLVIQPKLMKTVYPPHPCPTEEIYRSWCMNKAGIFDVSMMRYKKEPPPEKFKYVPSLMAHGKENLPQIQPRLIHGINVIRPSLNAAF
uniref:Cyclic nucleotide-binding domain-containing protein 2 n=1 Tax=Salvator merianae TaxID=96440 RepID=A0A8D0E5A1_SALMN